MRDHSHSLRQLVCVLSLSLLAGVASAADSVESALEVGLGTLWGQGLGERPATPLLLLWEMSLDEGRADEILQRADGRTRALTDTLLATLSLSEPLARRQLPSLHVVRDQDPAGPDRPPTWSDLRRVGLELLERIAVDPNHARDQRLQRELIAARARIERWMPSEVAGLVILWQQWWADRGDAPEFYLLPEQAPDIRPWLRRFADPRRYEGEDTLWGLLGALHDDPLRARMFVEALDADTHAFLAAESMEILACYPADFERRGFFEARWNPETGRLEGYRAARMREIAQEILLRSTAFFPSGVSEHERVRSCFLWWRRAQLEARYYRDPRTAPDLGEYLDGWDREEAAGGNKLASLLRRLYLRQEIRDVILDRFGRSQEAMTAELIEWLDMDFDGANERGFSFNYNLEPIRPVPSRTGPRAVIPLAGVRAIVRQLLQRVTDYELPADGIPEEEQDALWKRWWEGARRDPRWHRGEPPEYEDAPRLFQPERGRAGGR